MINKQKKIKLKKQCRWAWWHVSGTPEMQKLKWEGSEFKGSLGDIWSPCLKKAKGWGCSPAAKYMEHKVLGLFPNNTHTLPR